MNIQSQPLVSIITPVYNEEKYLAECIESVLAQTHSNWDLTIINNQSTDRSLEIAEHYAQRDRRIRVMTTAAFYPQICNHNVAMRQTSPESKYCKVVFGDNWLFPECLRLMVQAAEAYPTVGIVSALWLTSTGVQTNSLPYPSLFMPGRVISRLQLLSDEDYFGSPTMLLFRSEIVRKRDPFFREEARSPDPEACYEILQEWDFAFIHQLLTFNRTDNISTSSPSRRFAPFALNQLLHIIRYGHVFLSPAEHAAAQRRFEQSYYAFLAERAIERPRKAFWDYHRAALATIGESLSSRLLTKYVLLELLDIVLNLKKTAGRLLRSRLVRRATLAGNAEPCPGASLPVTPKRA